MTSRKYFLTTLLFPIAAAGCGGDFRSAATSATLSDTIVFDGAIPSCAACTLQIGDSVRIGSTTDADIPQRVPSILRDRRGYHYLVFHNWGNKQILRYDSSGRYWGKLGRYGRGPGEYSMSSHAFIGPGDSISIDADGRVQTFAPDGQFVRVAPMKRLGLTTFGIAPDGSGVIYATQSTFFPPGKDSITRVVRLNADGTPRDSFPIFSMPTGDTTTWSGGGSYKGRYPRRFESEPELSPDGSVWTSMQGNYRLERHTSDGRAVQLLGISLPPQDTLPRSIPVMTVARAESLIAGGTRLTPRRMVFSPTSKVPLTSRTTIQIADDGLLWVMHTVPASRWDTITMKTDRLSPNEAPDEETIPRNLEDRLYRTIIEIIDPERAQLITRLELPFLGERVAPGHIGRITEDDNGHYVTTVYRLLLTR